jgi:hypothetical protein
MNHGASAAGVVSDCAHPHSAAGKARGLRAEAFPCARVAAAIAAALSFLGPSGADLAAPVEHTPRLMHEP